MGAPNITAVETKRAEKWRRRGLTWTEIGDKMKRNSTSLSKAVQRAVGHDPVGEAESAAPKKKRKQKRTSNGATNGHVPQKRKKAGAQWTVTMAARGKKLPVYKVDLQKWTAVIALLETTE